MTQIVRRLWTALALATTAVAPLAAQTGGSVTGRVQDAATQRAVPGAQVRVANTNRSTVTDEEGRFTLQNVAAGSHVLQVTRVGFQPGSATVSVENGGAATATISLRSDALRLNELVVVGYGEQNRRSIAGSVSSIRAAETVSSTPVAQVDQVLQGRAAGVMVQQNSGVPGAAITVRVRGASSISAGNDPLYVIDGVPLIQGNFSSLNGTFGGQDIDALGDLNPNDIESIEVLKDASAAAIYGSRASNGVVLITTKKGRAARPTIEFNTYYGTQRAWRLPGFLTTEQYIEIYNEGYDNDGYGGIYAEDWGVGHANLFGYDDDDAPSCAIAENVPQCDEFEIPNRNNNWVETITRSAPIYNLSGSISGGNERARYFVTGSRFQQDGIVQGYGYERLSGRVNLDYAVNTRMTLGTNVALTRGVTDRARGDNTIYGPFANAIASAPFDVAYEADGEYGQGFIYDNPVALAVENQAEERSFHVLGNAFASYQLADGLSIRGTVGLDNYTLRSALYDSPVIGPNTGSDGLGAVGNANATKVLAEGTVSFNRDFGSHAFSGVLGSSFEDNDLETSSVEGTTFPTTQFRRVTSAAVITAGDGTVTENTLMSVFGRVTDTFMDKLTLTLNARADGSSRFGENNRWGFFPSAAVAYRLGEEPFLRDSRFLSDVSLRASWGLTGNQEGLGNFSSVGLFGAGANYGERPGIAPTQLPNPDLRWEQTEQINVGADLAFFEDRLGVSVDVYRKNTDDLLLSRPVRLTSGYGAFTENIGSLRNEGVELTLRGDVIRASEPGKLSWRSEFNISTNRNEVTALYNNEPITLGLAPSRIEIGQPLGVFYGWQMDGIFQSDDEVAEYGAQPDAVPGDVRFADINGDGTIDADDRTIIGNPWPEYQGGWTNTIAFRGFDLNVFTQFSQGGDIFDAMGFYTDDFGFPLDNLSTRALNRWTPENPNNRYPRSSWDNPNDNARESSRFVYDGSYVRIKNAVLGYTFGGNLAQRFGTRSMRLYVQGQNLVTWTDYPNFDPEVNYSGSTGVERGVDFYTLPQARTITFGLNFGF
jgi:TonB-dependent starch-binding outer membrane protein SusC